MLRLCSSIVGVETMADLLEQLASGAQRLTGGAFAVAAGGCHDGDLQVVTSPEAPQRYGDMLVAEALHKLASSPRRIELMTAPQLPEEAPAGRPPFGELLALALADRKDRRVGVLVVAAKQGSPFEQEDASLLEQLAELAAYGFERLAHCEALQGTEERLNETIRAREAFLSAVAHELRNPLAPLVSAAQLMQRSTDEAKRASAAEVIQRQAQCMVQLLEDLLDASRITQGLFRLQPQRLDLRLVIESSLTASRPLVDSRQHRLVVSCPDRPIPINGDPARLTQILNNLLNNASKFTPAGGEITLHCAVEDSEVVVRIRDSGVGISADAIAQLFVPFGCPTPARARGGGLGVGLALAHKLTQMHSGTLSADSDGPGHGSEFVVRLPLVMDEADALP